MGPIVFKFVILPSKSPNQPGGDKEKNAGKYLFFNALKARKSRPEGRQGQKGGKSVPDKAEVFRWLLQPQ
jgi:hypothetical protein